MMGLLARFRILLRFFLEWRRDVHLATRDWSATFAFYSTIAGITATLVGILAASSIAYFVFLAERSAPFDDRIEQDKVDIREVLLDLRAKWSIDHVHLLPPELRDAYWSEYPDKTLAELVYAASFDLNFDGRPLQRAVQDLKTVDQYNKGPWKGRCFVWTLAQAVIAIAGDKLKAQKLSLAAYPYSAKGPGFQQWRDEYERVDRGLQSMAFLKDYYLNDLKAYADTLPPDLKRFLENPIIPQQVTDFFVHINQVREKLADIDRQELMKARYQPRVDKSRVLQLAIGSFVLGVFFPLLILVIRERSRRIISAVVLIATSGGLIWTFVIFAEGVLVPLKETPHDYLRARWREPLLKELDSGRQLLEKGRILDRSVLLDAVNRHELPSALSASLGSYLGLMSQYNASALRLSERLVGLLKADPTIGRFVTKPSPNGGPSLEPADLITEANIPEFVRNFLRKTDVEAWVETGTDEWSRVLVHIKLAPFASRPDRLREGLYSVRKKIIADPATDKFLEEKGRVLKAGQTLEILIKKEL